MRPVDLGDLPLSFASALRFTAAGSGAYLLSMIAARAWALSGIGNERSGPAKSFFGSFLRFPALRLAIRPSNAKSRPEAALKTAISTWLRAAET